MRFALYNAIQSIDRKLVFVRNPKAGCSTVSDALAQYSKSEYCAGTGLDQTIIPGQGARHWRENLEALSDKEAVKFTFVRHPQARAISAFKNIFSEQSNNASPQHVEAARYFGFSENADTKKNIDAYLSYVEACFTKDINFTDPHFRLQKLNVGFGHVDYDMIGRLENIDTDLSRVFKMAGSDGYLNILGDIPKINKTSDEKIELTNSQKNRIEALYAPDYEAFDYA